MWNTNPWLTIYIKRLEQGTFERSSREPDDKHLEMDRTALSLLLSGIALKNARDKADGKQHRATRFCYGPIRKEPANATPRSTSAGSNCATGPIWRAIPTPPPPVQNRHGVAAS